jgi:hypothetical protein
MSSRCFIGDVVIAAFLTALGCHIIMCIGDVLRLL